MVSFLFLTMTGDILLKIKGHLPFRPKVIPDIHGLIDPWIACDKSGRFELSGALDYLIKQGGLLKSCDISDCYWHDVDNMEDLHHVRTAGLQLDE